VLHGRGFAIFFAAANKFPKFSGDYGGRIFGGFSAAAAAKISADPNIRRRLECVARL